MNVEYILDTLYFGKQLTTDEQPPKKEIEWLWHHARIWWEYLLERYMKAEIQDTFKNFCLNTSSLVFERVKRENHAFYFNSKETSLQRVKVKL